jgi:hypothetical protein
VVTVHAAQHEEGGTDQLSIDGLRGECYDPQPPKNHVSRHAQGGSDELSLTGLHGKAADGQTPALHDNEAHARTFVDAGAVVAAIGVHNATTAPHPTSTNLEFTIRKGAASGYAPLDGTAKVPLINLPPSQPSLARNQVFSLVDQDTPGPLNVLDTTIADAVLNPGGGLTIDFAAECGIVDTASVWIYLRLKLAGIYDDVFLEAGQELLTAGTWYFDGTFNILGIDHTGPKIIGDMFRSRRLQNSDQASSASMREAGIINYTTGGPIELKLGIALTPVVGDCHINLWRANLRRTA